jgi:hypothetical protein
MTLLIHGHDAYTGMTSTPAHWPKKSRPNYTSLATFKPNRTFSQGGIYKQAFHFDRGE